VIAAVVLAAGASTRFGSPKQRLLLPKVLQRLRTSGVDEIVVVLGAHRVEADARTVHCPDWERGPGASLRCGLAALAPVIEAAVVVLADGPALNPAAVDRVIAAWRSGARGLLAATYDGERGHPVLVPRSAWGSIPDEGLRAVAVEPVPADDLGPPGDVDYPSDFR